VVGISRKCKFSKSKKRKRPLHKARTMCVGRSPGYKECVVGRKSGLQDLKRAPSPRARIATVCAPLPLPPAGSSWSRMCRYLEGGAHGGGPRNTAGDCREDQQRSNGNADWRRAPFPRRTRPRRPGCSRTALQWGRQNLSALGVRDDPSRRQKSGTTHPDLDPEPR
jgi:hypothetical protein